ncbi:MAG: hypothetical protein HY279_03275 [Nitrospinae bacterium]|nr:hypothetical protein [Nitrospinota bacterium]
MISVKGIYDGKKIKPTEKIKAKKNTEVIITFLDDEAVEMKKKEKGFWKTFGAWKDIDVNKLIKEIYEDRKISRRKEVLM